jgi:hypothetical protein
MRRTARFFGCAKCGAEAVYSAIKCLSLCATSLYLVDSRGSRHRGLSQASSIESTVGAFGNSCTSYLARIARGQRNRLTSGVASPLQGAEQLNLHFSPLKRGRDPGCQTMCLPPGQSKLAGVSQNSLGQEARVFFLDNLLVWIHVIIIMIRWTDLAPWGCKSPFPGSHTSNPLEEPCDLSWSSQDYPSWSG